MAFKSHFSDKIEEIQPVAHFWSCKLIVCLPQRLDIDLQDFEDIIAASMELQNSPKFRKILEVKKWLVMWFYSCHQGADTTG